MATTSILQMQAARKAALPTDSVVETITEAAPVSPPAGGYKDLDLRQFIKSNGSIVRSVNGYFVPEDQEEYDLLEYYVSKGMLVEDPIK